MEESLNPGDGQIRVGYSVIQTRLMSMLFALMFTLRGEGEKNSVKSKLRGLGKKGNKIKLKMVRGRGEAGKGKEKTTTITKMCDQILDGEDDGEEEEDGAGYNRRGGKAVL